MEIYILDESLRRVDVVERYQSLIWTERFNAKGDFVLTLDPQLADPELFKQGTRLAINKSQYVMTIETASNKVAEDGNRVLEIKGPSLEDIMDMRPNQADFATAETPAVTLVMSGLPADIMRGLFDDICRSNTAIPDDNIEFIQTGEWSDPGSIPEPPDSVEIRTELDTLYNSIKNIADIYTLGFRLIRIDDDSGLYFEVYSGNDRTTGQTVNNVIAFSYELDNMTDTEELTSTATERNVAYVFAPNGSRIVFAPYADPSVDGFERRVLIVDANDITLTAGAPLDAALDQRGLEELAKNSTIIGFDGEVRVDARYVYGADYALGDLVEQRSNTGVVTNMRVTEQIFVSDAEGERNYPTLTFNSLISSGSWDSISGSWYWDSYTTEYWDDL